MLLGRQVYSVLIGDSPESDAAGVEFVDGGRTLIFRQSVALLQPGGDEMTVSWVHAPLRHVR